MKNRKVEKNYIVVRNDTFSLLNRLKEERQLTESYIVTNDVLIKDALQLYEKQRKS